MKVYRSKDLSADLDALTSTLFHFKLSSFGKTTLTISIGLSQWDSKVNSNSRWLPPSISDLSTDSGKGPLRDFKDL